ncbi:MAG: FAD-dependent oxidoreductase [Anaerolineales bacterium]|nr:FAD-dependent oxidoreductase [Anaerolineales bacterium]
MAKPVIITVDDEPNVLNAIERDLNRNYRKDYRVIKAGSGRTALDTVEELHRRGTPLALFVADQKMPIMTGTEFLDEARKFYPEAKKVLLTAYADTEAAIQSINEVGLDYYLMKPWDPPEDNLYPVLDDLLGEWTATIPVPYDGIKVVGAQWSPSSHHVKNFLSRNQVPYLWLDIEREAEAELLLEGMKEESQRLPVIFFPDGTVLVDPDSKELAEKAGLKTQASQPYYELIIIGAGPAGLAAAVYAGSEGLQTVMLEKEAVGGQAGTSSRIENYLGFPKGLSGADLARRAQTQARRFGVEILSAQEVVSVRVEGDNKFIRLNDGSELSCKALLVATGVTTRRLDAPGVDELTGAGVFYGASLAEAVAYKDQNVFVVGGANSAGQGAVHFARYAKKVIILCRASSLERGMSQYLVDQISAIENIEVITQAEVVQVEGTNQLEKVTYQIRESDEPVKMDAGALFIFIGAVPHTGLVEGVVERDRVGFIFTGSELIKDGRKPAGWKLQRDPFFLETSIPGIFAAGDVRHGSVKRVATAVGEGAVAISLIHQYLKTV